MHFLAGKKLLANCFFHATSEQEKQDILRLVQPKSIKVIPNFIRLPKSLKRIVNKHTSTLNLLFLSRIEAKKGLEILLEALEGIDFPYRLTIAGSGEAAYIATLKNIVHKRSMEPCVKWIGFQNDETKFEVMQTHDLLVLPSYNENFGNVVIESLAVGTAVLISELVGSAAYVTENNLGWTFDNQPEKLREQLVKINLNRNWLDEIRIKSPQQIKQDFADGQLIKQYINFYEEILLHD